MSRGEEKANSPNHGAYSGIPESSWKASSVVANVLIFAVAGAFAILALLLFLFAMSMLLGAFLAGPHIFQAMAVLVCVGAVCLASALGLCLRLITAWWFAVLSSLAISAFAIWLLLTQDPSEVAYIQWTAGMFLAVFISLIYIRKFYFKSARDWWQAGY